MHLLIRLKCSFLLLSTSWTLSWCRHTPTCRTLSSSQARVTLATTTTAATRELAAKLFWNILIKPQTLFHPWPPLSSSLQLLFVERLIRTWVWWWSSLKKKKILFCQQYFKCLKFLLWYTQRPKMAYCPSYSIIELVSCEKSYFFDAYHKPVDPSFSNFYWNGIWNSVTGQKEMS